MTTKIFLIFAVTFFSLSLQAQVTKPFGFFKKPARPSNIILRTGDSVTNPARLEVDNYHIRPQEDGNLVLYREIPFEVKWYTNTWSGSGSCNSCTLIFEADGSLKFRDSIGGNVRWSSNTPSAAGGYVEFRNKTPNLIIYNSSGVAVWNN